MHLLSTFHNKCDLILKMYNFGVINCQSLNYVSFLSRRKIMTMLFVIKHYYKINELILKYIIKLKEHNIYEENISKKNFFRVLNL